MNISTAFATVFLVSWVAVTAEKVQSFHFFDIRGYLHSEPFENVLKESSDAISKECLSAMSLYLSGVLEGADWAWQMADSMPKFLDGILMGRTHYPGHFDECVEAQSGSFKGKHCMVQIFPDSLFNPNGSKPSRDLLKDLFSFYYGLCVPSTCTAKDINHLITRINILDSVTFLNMTENNCATNDWRPYRTEDILTVCLILILLLLAVLSTAYDVRYQYSKENESPNQLLASFSFYSNVKYLFRVSQSAVQLKCIYGIRSLSIAWVVLCHAYLTMALGAPLNTLRITDYFHSSDLIPISNGVVAVDTFFFLSGLLVCLVFFRDISKKGYFDVPVAFIHRYIRITPSFAMVMLLQATVLTRMGNGPFWNEHMDRAEADCRRSWWTGLLYLQNYLKPDALCLGQSWYLSADMQMFWFSPLILYPMLLWPAFAPFFLVFAILIAVSINFTIAYLYELQPSLGFALGQGNVNFFKIDYVPFHMRISSWLVGLTTGYIVCGIQAQKIRVNLSKTMVIIGWILGLGILFGTFFSLIPFYSMKYTPLEAAFYLAFHRVGWTIGLSWILIACVCGYGGPINSFLGWDGFQPLAKLSYSLFLVHMSFQFYRLYTARVNQYIDHFTIVHLYVADLVISLILAVPLTLLVEIPSSHIDRYFFQKTKILPYPRRQKVTMKDEIIRAQERWRKNLENKLENPTFKEP